MLGTYLHHDVCLHIFDFFSIWELTSLALINKTCRIIAHNAIHSLPYQRIPAAPSLCCTLPKGILFIRSTADGTKPYSYKRLVKMVKVASGASLEDAVVWSQVPIQEESNHHLVPPDNPWRRQSRTGEIVGGRARMIMYDDHFGKPEAIQILNRLVPTRLFTSGTNCWFLIDLGDDFKLNPSGYALRYHRPVLKRNAAPRDWMLQGSESGERWIVLSEHRNDTTIEDRDGAVGIFRVDSRDKFQMFRIVLLSKEENDRSMPFNYSSLYISGIEFFGTLWKQSTVS